MKRQRLAITAVLAIGAASFAVWWFASRMRPTPFGPESNGAHSIALEDSQSASTLGTIAAAAIGEIVDKTMEMRPMTLEAIERLGHAPEGAWPEEWRLAEKTSWWGKPIDSGVFWRHTPVWLDAETRWRASSRGRQSPPLPFEDADILKYSAEDTQNKGYAGVEGYTPRYVGNLRERNFWAKWSHILPQPPPTIDQAQTMAARSIMWSERQARIPPDQQRGRPLSGKDVAERWKRLGNSASADGYPPEAFERSAIYIAFVLSVYQKQGADGLATWRGIIPDKYLDAPEDELREMDKKWKRAYLDRLKNELPQHPQLTFFLDGYIKAYSEAWAL